MEITVHLEKSLEESAGVYFDKAKKLRKKTEGASRALAVAQEKLETIDRKIAEETRKETVRRQRSWYEKFRWFRTSEGLLVIGGRDAHSNEIVIKKHAEQADMVLHTDMAGSPFFVIKAEGRQIGEVSLLEAAEATASYSRAWKLGHSDASVFVVRPDQVSKTAKSGEHLPRGAFMIYGETRYLPNRMRLAIGVKDGQLFGGPLDSVRSAAQKYVEVIQGDTLPSKAAKEIQKVLGGDIDDILT
jgi:predicted ribosome quality control (RQC) complex YloA/Tae2 family protein